MFYKELKEYFNYRMAEESAATLSFLICAVVHLAGALIFIGLLHLLINLLKNING